jgi:hypothetical protein
MAFGPARRQFPANEPDGSESGGAGGVSDMVEQPAKVLRMGTMARQLPVEVHAARLDEASRVRLREIHERSIKELERGLAEDLRDKLNRAVHRGLHSVRR